MAYAVMMPEAGSRNAKRVALNRVEYLFLITRYP